jgi:hypothetical protein
MKIYPPEDGYTKEEMRRGIWSLDADVKCSNPECGKEYSVPQVGGIGGLCLRCGERCL